MSQAPDHIELLMQLGLTLNEARVYLTLSEMGKATAKALSRNSGVTREFIYQILPKLYKKGIAEVVITSPKTFRAIPLKKAYAVLMQQKEQENSELQQKIEDACKRCPDVSSQNPDEPQIFMIPTGKAMYSRISQEYKDVHQSIDLTIPLKKFLDLTKFFYNISKVMTRREVKLRILVEKQEQDNVEKYEDVTPMAEIKFINTTTPTNPTPIEMMLFDKKRLMFSTSAENSIDKMTWLYANNPFIIKLASNYFKTKWALAAPAKIMQAT
ncbi:MAG: hypothetical protein NWF04_04470 [Candidatus Bathyarchaeota archaeon]|nr:hypothetical protein [Candidatus Bathyarchaeota archaeon]